MVDQDLFEALAKAYRQGYVDGADEIPVRSARMAREIYEELTGETIDPAELDGGA